MRDYQPAQPQIKTKNRTQTAPPQIEDMQRHERYSSSRPRLGKRAGRKKFVLSLIALFQGGREVSGQFTKSDIIGRPYDSGNTTNEFVSDASSILSEYHWCYYSSWYVKHELVFTTGETKTATYLSGSGTCGSVTGLSDKTFTSACYDIGSYLNPGFRLDYSGGSVIIGPNAPSNSCTSVSLPKEIKGISFDTNAPYMHIKFLFACDYTEDTSGVVAYSSSINLLDSGTYTFVSSLPTITSTPTSCYTTSFDLYRTSDDHKMTVDFPSLFTATGTEFTFTNDPSNITDRIALFDSGATGFYVKRTLTGVEETSYTEELSFTFSVDFLDPCRSASLIDQTITFADVVWNIDTTSQISVPAFQDSVDQTGTYTIGICGEKEVILSSGTPSFMTLTVDSSDPIINNFTIDYAQSSASESDIGPYTIGYEVSSKEYSSQVEGLTSSSFAFTILCPSTTTGSTVSSALVSTADFEISDGLTVSLTAPVIAPTPIVCFTIGSLLVYDSATSTLVTSYLSVNGKSTIDIFTNDRTLVGVYNLYVQSIVAESSEEIGPQYLTLTITDACLSTTLTGTIDIQPVTVFKGEANNVVQSFNILTDSVSDASDGARSCGLIAYEVLDSLGQAAPSIVSLVYKEGDSTFSVEADAEEYDDVTPTIFNLVVEAKLTDYYPVVPIVSSTFSVSTLDPCDTAQLTGSLDIQAMSVQAGVTAKFTQSVGILSDSVSDAFQVVSNCGAIEYSLVDSVGYSAPSYVTLAYTEGDPTFNIEVDVKDYKGSSQVLQLYVKAQLSDYSVPSMRAQFEIDILEVEKFVFVPPPAPVTEPAPAPPVIEPEEPIVEETQQPFVPVIQEPQSENDELPNQLKQDINEDQTAYPNPVPSITSTTHFGGIEISFSEPLRALPSELDISKLTFDHATRRNLQSKPAFSVSIVPSALQEPQNVLFTWEIVEFTSSKMKLQLTFEFALHISFQEADTLVIEFADPDLFVTEHGIRILPEHRRLKKPLKKQIPDDAKATQENINSSADNSKTATTVIMVSQILLGAGLKSVLDMINALQVIILLPLIETQIPANASMFMQTLTDVAAFDFIEIGDVSNDILSLPPTEPVNMRFELSSLESQYFVNNVGSFYLVILLNILMALVWCLIKLIRTCCYDGDFLEKYGRKIHRKLFWNGSAAAVRESYLVVILCAFISINYNFNFTSLGMHWQSMSVLVVLTVYIVVPIVVLAGVLRNFLHLDTDTIKARYGSFYDGLAIRNGKKVLYQPCYFLARRMYLCYLVIFGTAVFTYQMAQIMAAALIAGLLPYLILSLRWSSERRQNIINEMLTLFSCYAFLSFNIVSVETNFQLGYLVIGVLGGYMFIVIVGVVISSINKICWKLRICCIKRTYRKQRANAQKNLELNHAKLKRRLQQTRKAQIQDTEQTIFEIDVTASSKDSLEIIEEVHEEMSEVSLTDINAGQMTLANSGYGQTPIKDRVVDYHPIHNEVTKSMQADRDEMQLKATQDNIDEQFKSLIDSILVPNDSSDDLYEIAVGRNALNDMHPGGQQTQIMPVGPPTTRNQLSTQLDLSEIERRRERREIRERRKEIVGGPKGHRERRHKSQPPTIVEADLEDDDFL